MAAATPAPQQQAPPPIPGLDRGEPAFEELVSAFLEDEPARKPAKGQEGPDDDEREEEDDERAERSAAVPDDDDDEEGEEEAEETPAPAAAAAPAKAKAEEPAGPQMLAEIAKEYGVPDAEFLDTVHLAGADGAPVPLKRVVEEWQSLPDRVERGLSQGRAELAQSRARYEAEAAPRITELARLAREMKVLTQLDPEPDWEQLESADPERYATERVKWVKRKETLEGVRRAFTEEQQRDARQQAEQLEHFQREQGRLLAAARPDWRDNPVVAKAALTQVDRYLRETGWTDEHLSQPLDYRMILNAWEASEYRRIKGHAAATGKRLRHAPRLVPGTARRGEGDAAGSRSERIEKKKAVLRKTGSDAAADALFEEFA